MAAPGAYACKPWPPDDDLAKNGRNVVVGTVVSTRFAERPPNARAAGVMSTNTYSLRQQEMLADVEVKETLLGATPTTVTGVSPCTLPLQVGERVVVATYSGRRVVFPADMYEQSFRVVHGGER